MLNLKKVRTVWNKLLRWYDGQRIEHLICKNLSSNLCKTVDINCNMLNKKGMQTSFCTFRFNAFFHLVLVWIFWGHFEALKWPLEVKTFIKNCVHISSLLGLMVMLEDLNRENTSFRFSNKLCRSCPPTTRASACLHNLLSRCMSPNILVRHSYEFSDEPRRPIGLTVYTSVPL